jgi:hypothetical protein
MTPVNKPVLQKQARNKPLFKNKKGRLPEGRRPRIVVLRSVAYAALSFARRIQFAAFDVRR